jgi:hypothetical protein
MNFSISGRDSSSRKYTAMVNGNGITMGKGHLFSTQIDEFYLGFNEIWDVYLLKTTPLTGNIKFVTLHGDFDVKGVSLGAGESFVDKITDLIFGDAHTSITVNGQISGRTFKATAGDYVMKTERDSRIPGRIDSNLLRFERVRNIEFIGDGTGGGKIIIQINKKIIKIDNVEEESGRAFVDKIKEFKNRGKEIIESVQRSEVQTEMIEIFAGDINRPYQIAGPIFAKVDSSILSSTVTMDDVNARLREEALKLDANAIIHVKYERYSTTSFRGIKASGVAVFLASNEKKCPFCAELIKNEAVKCKHCGSELE